MAKSTGTTRSIGSGTAGMARTFTASEYREYFAMQKAGAMESLASGRITQSEYNSRIADLAKRETKLTGSSPLTSEVKDSAQKTVDNTVKWISGSNSTGSIRINMDRAEEMFSNGEISRAQRDRIISAGEKKIKELTKK